MFDMFNLLKSWLGQCIVIFHILTNRSVTRWCSEWN